MDLRVLDIRESRESRDRLYVANSYRIPFATLRQQRCFAELPEPSLRLIIFYDREKGKDPQQQHPRRPDDEMTDMKDTVEDFLAVNGWRNIALCSSREELIATGVSEERLQHIEPINMPLWRPGPLIRMFCNKCEERNTHNEVFWMPPTDEKKGLVLDLGSGVCRDAIVWCCLGYDVIAVDQREVILKNGRHLAGNWAVETFTFQNDNLRQDDQVVERRDEIQERKEGRRASGRLFTVAAKCESSGELVKLVRRVLSSVGEDSHVDIVYCSRFLERKLFAGILELARKHVVYHHFLIGSVRPTQADQVLEEGELARIFENWTITCDEIFEIVDHVGKRKFNNFIATRRSI